MIEQRWKATEEALECVKAGQIIDGHRMLKWIRSWGKKSERKPPR